MFQCKFCDHKYFILKEYILHLAFHRNIPNFTFQCGVSNCTHSFKTCNSLKSHIYRDHKYKKTVTNAKFKCLEREFECQADHCSVKCTGLSDLFAHIKSHIRNGEKMACPFRNCSNEFVNISTFTSHLSRKHQNSSVQHLDYSVSETESAPTHVDSPYENSLNIDNDQCTEMEDQDDNYLSMQLDEAAYLNNLARFYLKLQSKQLLPASTIQNIIEGYQEVHDLGQLHLFSHISEKLKGHGISEDDTNDLLSDLKKHDLLTACNKGVLRTDQTRKTFFKSEFRYVDPIPIYLGENEKGKESFCQYVPIQDTIKALFQFESVREQHAMTKSQLLENDILTDVYDGTNMQKNELFKSDKSAISVILYQDAFEVVNPLGSGKIKHKILAVYLTLGNLLPHNRSNIDHMQLVLLCREQDFKYFGHDQVLNRLLADIKDLELNGVAVGDGQKLKGTLCAIAGDNLGSHHIGGFLENFSTSLYFCRYCEIHRETFENNPIVCGRQRNIELHKSRIQDLNENSLNSSYGLKFDSMFNQLKYFHVAQPGLPPCLGHDLFEGIVSYDLALFLKHLVSKDKYFTYVQLNRSIGQFRYLGSDADNKPCEVNSEAKKLSGHAVQNWCFLRLLPLLVGDRIVDPFENTVWQMVLKLREIVELVCAPTIIVDQVAYLRVLIDEYIHLRTITFPDHPIKPKHHYLLHYPVLIIQLGPLIRLWTLRFESKHTYFKQCARKLHNFKNPCQTLAERHQLLQAYLSTGYLFPPLVQVQGGVDFYADTYNLKITESVKNFNFQPWDTVAVNEVTYKGTKYKYNMLVVIGVNEEGIVFGRIKLVLIYLGSQVYFVTEKHQSNCLIDQGIHCLNKESTVSNYVCVSQEKLADYYPLPEYKLCGLSVVALHHSIPQL